MFSPEDSIFLQNVGFYIMSQTPPPPINFITTRTSNLTLPIRFKVNKVVPCAYAPQIFEVSSTHKLWTNGYKTFNLCDCAFGELGMNNGQ